MPPARAARAAHGGPPCDRSPPTCTTNGAKAQAYSESQDETAKPKRPPPERTHRVDRGGGGGKKPREGKAGTEHRPQGGRTRRRPHGRPTRPRSGKRRQSRGPTRGGAAGGGGPAAPGAEQATTTEQRPDRNRGATRSAAGPAPAGPCPIVRRYHAGEEADPNKTHKANTPALERSEVTPPPQRLWPS